MDGNAFALFAGVEFLCDLFSGGKFGDHSMRVKFPKCAGLISIFAVA